MAWANPEIMIRAMLSEKHGIPQNYGVATPNDLASRLPFHRITLVRGSDDTLTDSTVIDIETFAPTRLAASEEAEIIRGVMLSLQGRADGAGRWLVDSVRTIMRPVWMDYRNSEIQRYIATYAIDTRPVEV